MRIAVLVTALIAAIATLLARADEPNQPPVKTYQVIGHKTIDSAGRCLCTYEQYAWPCDASAQSTSGYECTIVIEVRH